MMDQGREVRLRGGVIPVVGTIGEGGEVQLFDDMTDELIERLTRPAAEEPAAKT